MKEKENLLHLFVDVPKWRWGKIKQAFSLLTLPKEVAPPLRDRLRYILSNFRLLLPIPDRLMERRMEEWGRGLKLVFTNAEEKIYERRGLLYVVPNDKAFVGQFVHFDFCVNLFGQYEEPPVIVEKRDIVIDCGASIGVASLLFAQKAGKEGKVIAIEPEEKNYQVLEKVSKLNEGKVAPIIPLKVAVYKEDCWLELNVGTHPGAHALSTYYDERKAFLLNTTEKVQALKIDTLVESLGLERVDFIKMDIEGAEVDALLGAEETIKGFKPKLAICTYHRPTDPVEIRKILLKYNPNYKFKELERGEKVLYAWDASLPLSSRFCPSYKSP